MWIWGIYAEKRQNEMHVFVSAANSKQKEVWKYILHLFALKTLHWLSQEVWVHLYCEAPSNWLNPSWKLITFHITINLSDLTGTSNVSSSHCGLLLGILQKVLVKQNFFSTNMIKYLWFNDYMKIISHDPYFIRQHAKTPLYHLLPIILPQDC